MYRALRPGARFAASVVYYAKGIYRYVDVHPIYLLSAGIAFNVVLCAMPFLFLLTYLLGQVIAWPTLLGTIDHQLAQVVTNAVYRAEIIDALRAQIETLSHTGRVAGIAGCVGAIWTSTALFSSIRTAMNNVYGLHAPKFFAVYKLYDIVLILGLGVAVVLSNMVSPMFAVVRELGQEFVPPAVHVTLDRLGAEAVRFFASFALFYLPYRYMCHQRVPLKSAVIGAVTAAILWECAKAAFVYYLTSFPTLGIVYGAYTFLVVVALWLYYSALVFVMGGILTRLHWERALGSD